jgi:predicted dienelactone hydrolase
MNLKSAIAACLLAFTFFVSPARAEAREVGVMNFSYDAPHRDRLVQSLIFYPSEQGGKMEWLGDNIVFRGVPVMRDAMPERKKHPLVVVSHGSGGSAASVAWLARRLAEEGFVVVIPNHQGSTSGDSTPETTIPAVWQRPADITGLLNAIAASVTVRSLVDPSNITALGFSLGGGTVLNLAGGQLRADKLAKFCDENPELPIGCSWLAKGNALIPGHVDLHKIDAARFNASYPDARFNRFIAIDPSMVPALDIDSLKTIAAPVQIINLGDFESLPNGVRADHISAAIPNGLYAQIEGANHFSFLGECKRLGWFYVWMEGDDPVCTESGAKSRDVLHRKIGDKILAFLKHGVS